MRWNMEILLRIHVMCYFGFLLLNKRTQCYNEMYKTNLTSTVNAKKKKLLTSCMHGGLKPSKN